MTAAIIWCPSDGGHFRYVMHLARAIAALPHDQAVETAVLTRHSGRQPNANDPVRVITFGKAIKPKSSFPTRLHWLLDRVFFHVGEDLSLLRWLRKNPDCQTVHLQESHYLNGPLLIWLIRFFLRRSVVLTLHNLTPHALPGFIPRTWYRSWYRLGLSRCHAVIVHTEPLKKSLLKQFILETHKVSVVPHGVWHVDATSDALVPAPDNDPGPGSDDTLKLLFYGTIRPNKGLHKLLDAMKSAPKSWCLTIAGNPADNADYFERQIRPRLETLKRDGHPIATRFEYVPDAQVAGYFKRADLLLLPYLDFDAQSGVLFDAIAMKLPIVCSNAGAIGDTVRRFGIGVVADSADSQSLIDAIAKASKLDHKQVQTALQAAANSNSWSDAASKTTAVYRGVQAH